MNKPLRVVCLFGTGVIFDKTLAVLLENNINVVGVCNANKHKKGVDFHYLKIAVKKYGIFKVMLQIFERILYKILNSGKDRKIYNSIYDQGKINKTLELYKGVYHKTENYQNPETLKWLEEMNPDIFLVHSGYWVGKKVRKLVGDKCLGGHPGITPDYRGVHSPFWAVYNDEPEKIGYTVFWLNDGVDMGDIIIQGTTPVEKGDSYFTLSWKGMVCIAEQQAETIKKMEEGVDIPVRKIVNVDEKTNYTHPTIFQYLKYRFKQNNVR